MSNRANSVQDQQRTSISFSECEPLPQLLVEELVDRGVGVDSGTRIAVPVPDTARGSTLLEDLDFVALLSEPRMVSGRALEGARGQREAQLTCVAG